jgi:trehalose 6-phosphate synthase/phosphatase
MSLQSRVVIVSNRLPVTLMPSCNGFEVQPSAGGLVSALLPVFKDNGGTWAGWPGTAYDPEVEKTLRRECAPQYSLEPVFLSHQEKQQYYDGCCNAIIWPLFHDLQCRCNFDPGYWSAYCDVNDKFADVIFRCAGKDDLIWVHDFHLMLLGDCLRARGVRTKIAYFHHIPFPPPDIFEKLPWKTEILLGLMQFSKLGFQTDHDRRNFVSCLRSFLKGVHIRHIGRKFLVRADNLVAEVGTFPISIDFQDLAEESATDGVLTRAEEVRHSFGGRQLVLGVDRLDYTKGIQERLRSFRTLLDSEPGLCGRVNFLQLTVPSRENIPEYREYKISIDRLVSEINARYGRPGWSPITYLHRCVSKPELLALYRAADVALVTPLKDGMNLVAKEFCAARNDERGVLVLSKFAGSAAELKSGALLINPYDFEGVASALSTALKMPVPEQQRRMRSMRAAVEQNDVYTWCNSVCGQMGLRRRTHASPAVWLPLRAAVAQAV